MKEMPPLPATNLLNVEKTVPVAPEALSPALTIFEVVPLAATCQIPAEVFDLTAPKPTLRKPVNVMRPESSKIGSPTPENTALSGALAPIPAARLVVLLLPIHTPPKILDPATP
jgi:hypothetical protein